MSDNEADIKADIEAVEDRGENLSAMEPLVLGEGSRHRAALSDLAIDLAARSSGFRRSVPAGVAVALADLVRSMNCYYSNLIEGHNTHPVDIERAMRADFSADRTKRNLQLEARDDLPALLGTGERQARRVASGLIGRGVLTSESTRANLRLTFPAALAARWMPGLFPEQTARPRQPILGGSEYRASLRSRRDADRSGTRDHPVHPTRSGESGPTIAAGRT